MLPKRAARSRDLPSKGVQFMLWNASRTLVCLVVGIVAVFSPFVAAQDFPPEGTFDHPSTNLEVSDDFIASISGNTLIVRDRTTFDVIREFSPPNGGSSSGSLAIRGDSILIAGNTDTIVVYSVAQDQIVQTITRTGEQLFDVAVNADRIIVRSLSAAYLYLNNGNPIATIPAAVSGGTPFGHSLALSEQYGLITLDNRVLVIDPATGQMLTELVPDPDNTNKLSAVAIDGNIAIIGHYEYTLPGDQGGRGTAWVFDVSTGELLHQFDPPAQYLFGNFGYSVAICHDFFLVGYPGDRVFPDVGRSGTAYLYRRSDGLFLGRLVPAQSIVADVFGRTVALHGGLSFAGSFAYAQTHWYRAGAAGFAQQPVSQVVAANAAAVMQVVLFDDTDVAFQWYLNGKPVVDGPNFQGANTAVLNITARPEAAGIYECFVTRDDLLPVTSSQAVLTVLADPNACYADANNDGQLNFFDIAQYIQLFNAGCP